MKYFKCGFTLFVTLVALPLVEGSAWPRYVDFPQTLPDEYDLRDDAKLILRIPYKTVLKDERVMAYVAIVNQGDQPIQLARSIHLGRQWGYQALWQAKGEDSEDIFTMAPFIPFWEEVEEVNFRNAGEWNEIQKNEALLYTPGYAIPIYDIVPEGAAKVRVGLLTGPNEWLFSDWVSVQRVNQSVEDGDIVRNISRRTIVRQVEVEEGESYLFWNRRRIAKVPVGATPAVGDMDYVQHRRPITFDGVDQPPLVIDRFYMPVEWTKETAPHMIEWESLKEEVDALIPGGNVEFINKSESED